MLKKSIGIGLLLVTGQAFSADITVTTNLDNDVNDKECSLREAIKYINAGVPKEGYNGCGGENSSTTILLKEKENYVLTLGELSLSETATIKTNYETNVTETVNKGLKNAIISNKTGRIFHIAPKLDETVKEIPNVKINELTLKGCGTNCDIDKGGLVYAAANLTLDFVKLSSGYATQGGAIYIPSKSSEYLGSGLATISNTLIEQNVATFGAAIYADLTSYRIKQSVIRKNNTTDSSSANVYIKDGATTQNSAYIYNSTLYDNTGNVLNIVDGLAINNATIVRNKNIGVIYSASNKLASLANSIVLDNKENCSTSSSSDKANTVIQNNITTLSCGLGDDNYRNKLYKTGLDPYEDLNTNNDFDSDLIASNSVEGVCPNIKQFTSSILCPFKESEDRFLGYFRPRILLSYNKMSDSPIVDQGAKEVSGSTRISCDGTDQRELQRPQNPVNLACDRGAIEIVVPTSSSLLGKDLKFGEIAKFSILEALGDSDLIPKAQCNKLVGEPAEGEFWQDGCMVIEQEKHVSSKGKMTIDLDGNLVYTPNSNWHGADIMTVKVITTTTRFNESDPYLPVRVNIVQEPSGSMESDKIKTSGGSTGLGWLAVVLGLLIVRRTKQ